MPCPIEGYLPHQCLFPPLCHSSFPQASSRLRSRRLTYLSLIFLQHALGQYSWPTRSPGHLAYRGVPRPSPERPNIVPIPPPASHPRRRQGRLLITKPPPAHSQASLCLQSKNTDRFSICSFITCIIHVLSLSGFMTGASAAYGTGKKQRLLQSQDTRAGH